MSIAKVGLELVYRHNLKGCVELRSADVEVHEALQISKHFTGKSAVNVSELESSGIPIFFFEGSATEIAIYPEISASETEPSFGFAIHFGYASFRTDREQFLQVSTGG